MKIDIDLCRAMRSESLSVLAVLQEFAFGLLGKLQLPKNEHLILSGVFNPIPKPSSLQVTVALAREVETINGQLISIAHTKIPGIALHENGEMWWFPNHQATTRVNLRLLEGFKSLLGALDIGMLGETDFSTNQWVFNRSS